MLLIAVLAVFEVQFTMKIVYYSLLGIFLSACIALMIASQVGFRRLKHAREMAFLVQKQAECTTAACLLQKRTFSKEHITYITMM
jgi:ABC-type tungstate transport system substrate-binding protein